MKGKSSSPFWKKGALHNYTMRKRIEGRKRLFNKQRRKRERFVILGKGEGKFLHLKGKGGTVRQRGVIFRFFLGKRQRA